MEFIKYFEKSKDNSDAAYQSYIIKNKLIKQLKFKLPFNVKSN